ncbi:alpha/beta hydrolase family protein [Streptosporangium sp. NPDC000396]|uniref:alpha/beta hydrolase family protein n=1 Tax=Streptosporangium sp. NPDC000396 TaxID=3366185 RepID=UPI00367800A2
MLRSVLAVVLLAAGLGAVVVYQSDYDIREEQVTVTGGTQPLKGVLAWPTKGKGPFGLVVFVHGDGPIDATHDTNYRPLWEAFAQSGYASLSWNKPGVGGAPGNWLDQSMEDRARETMAAIAWAKSRPGIDGHRIGLWGASQAGWVMPKVAARMPDLRFVIAVSPAINWLQQGRFNTMAELRAKNTPEPEIQAELAKRETRLKLLRKGVTFDEYRAAIGDVQGLTADRWRFINKNYTSDAKKDLAAMRTPVLLALGGHDINVDVADTEAGYRKLLREPGRLQVKHYPDATHGIVPKDIEDSKLKITLVVLFAPRLVYASGFLADQRRFLEKVGGGA